MPAELQAARQARTQNTAHTRRASQRRAVVARTTGASMDRPERPSPAPARRARSRRTGVTGARRTGEAAAAGAAVGSYLPTRAADKASSGIGALEAEYVGGLLLIFLTVFTDTGTSYSDKMLSVMKRGTLLSILFFIMALVAGLGNNASRAMKAFGALIDVGILISVVAVDPATGQSQFLSEIQNFIKGDWKASNASASSGNAPATGPAAAAGNASSALKNAFQTGGLPAALAGNPAILWLEQNGGNLANLPSDLAKQLPGDIVNALKHLLP